MQIDNIIANPPYGKLGVDITNHIVNQVPHKDISILGTRAMLSKHNESLNLEYVYIEGYTLSPVTKCKWVAQVILLGHKGTCKVIPDKCDRHNGKIMPNEIRVPFGIQCGGHFHIPVNVILTRNRVTSHIISVSDDDYEYIKEHWNDMSYIERFWWLHDHGLYKQFKVEKRKKHECK